MDYDVQHTFRGRTAGGWLKTAKTVEMNAGNWAVILDGNLSAVATDNGNMIIDDGPEFVVMLDMSHAAYATLAGLTDFCNASTTPEYTD